MCYKHVSVLELRFEFLLSVTRDGITYRRK